MTPGSGAALGNEALNALPLGPLVGDTEVPCSL